MPYRAQQENGSLPGRGINRRGFPGGKAFYGFLAHGGVDVDTGVFLEDFGDCGDFISWFYWPLVLIEWLSFCVISMFFAAIHER